MNTYAVVFAALIVAAAANSVSRTSGWGAPAAPVIDVELDAALAAAGSGQAAASQQLAEHASGNQGASLSSSSGVYAGAVQSGESAQVATANLPSGDTATLQGISVAQDVAGYDSLAADLYGDLAASVANSGQNSASGEGVVAAEGATLNEVIRP